MFRPDTCNRLIQRFTVPFQSLRNPSHGHEHAGNAPQPPRNGNVLPPFPNVVPRDAQSLCVVVQRRLQIALLVLNIRNHGPKGRRVRVARPNALESDAERLIQLIQCFVQLPLLPKDQPDALACARHVLAARPELVDLYLQSLVILLQSSVQPPQLLQHTRHVPQRLGHLRMLPTHDARLDIQGLLVLGQRLLVLALVREDIRDVHEGRRHSQVLLAKSDLKNGLALLVMRKRIIVVPKLLVDHAHAAK
mmetsp:Transcript_41612/g.102073  ORF Transcript_41612/g.102073 Transcript_41612/m.102073 type:complete len:249 (-) Transcript_41612:689-1435(-)